MPIASSENIGNVILYIGTSSNNYKKGHLYICTENNSTYSWQDLQTGLYAVGNCSNIRCITQGTTVRLKWQDPNDTMIGDVLIAKWDKTVVVRKQGSIPTNISDGTIIVTSSVRNQYSTTAYIDTIPDSENTYYYKLFPYTDDGIITNDDINSIATGELTWATIKDICYNDDPRNYFSVGDVLMTEHSFLSTDNNGHIEFQITDITDHDIGLLAYKVVGYAQFDAPEKAYALTLDEIFHTEYLLTISGYNTVNGDYFLKDESSIGTDRIWRRKTGTYELKYIIDKWIIFNTLTDTITSTQTTSSNEPWNGIWSNNINVIKSKKYYIYDGSQYIEQNVIDGDSIPLETYYEYNPGGTNRINQRIKYL